MPRRGVSFELPDGPLTEGIEQVTARTLFIPVGDRYYVGRQLATVGLAHYEPETVATFLSLLAEDRPGCVVDVGANIGLYSWLAAASSARRVDAFEPVSELAAVIRSVGRRLGDRIHVHDLALADREATADLYMSSTSDVSNSLVPGFRPTLETRAVRLARLDDVLVERPHIVKIDVETAEPEVFAGGLDTIAQTRPFILCELLNDRIASAVRELVEPFGYVGYRLTDRPELLPDDEIAASSDPSGNWLFSPEPLSSQFCRTRAGWLRELAFFAPTAPLPGQVPTPPFVAGRGRDRIVHPTWRHHHAYQELVRVEPRSGGRLRCHLGFGQDEHAYISHGVVRGFDRPASDRHCWRVSGGRHFEMRLPARVRRGAVSAQAYVIQYSNEERICHAVFDPVQTDRFDFATDPATTSMRLVVQLRGTGVVDLGGLVVRERGPGT